MIITKNSLTHYGVQGMKWKDHVYAQGPIPGYGNNAGGAYVLPTSSSNTTPAGTSTFINTPSFKTATATGAAGPTKADLAKQKAIDAQNKKNAAAAERVAAKALQDLNNLKQEAQDRQDAAKAEIEYEVQFEKAKKDPKYDEKAHRAKLETMFASSLHATADSVKKEKVAAHQHQILAAVAKIHGVTLH